MPFFLSVALIVSRPACQTGKIFADMKTHKTKGDPVQSKTDAMPTSNNNNSENQNEGDPDGSKLISDRNEGNSQASADMKGSKF
jgi:hypothetical protein